MKKIGLLAAVLILAVSGICFADNFLLDDFEMAVSGGAEGTVDFGSGNGSSLQVTAATDIKNTGKQSLKAAYDAVSGGYMYIARGSGLDAKNATWTVKPSEIKWTDYSGISFYVYGTNSKAKIAFDVKDSGGELFRFITEDYTAGWKKVVVSFDKFIARDDWQPQDADKNGVIDFPVKSFQFEPLPVSKGTLYFDTVELIKK